MRGASPAARRAKAVLWAARSLSTWLWRIGQFCMIVQPYVRRERKAPGRYRLSQYRRNGRICRASPAQLRSARSRRWRSYVAAATAPGWAGGVGSAQRRRRQRRRTGTAGDGPSTAAGTRTVALTPPGGGAAQPHLEPVAPGQPPDHHQAEPVAGGVGGRVGPRAAAGQPLVGPGQLLVGHAKAAVGDLDQVPVAVGGPGDHDRG